MEIQINDDRLGSLTWNPPGPAQETIARVEQVNFGLAEQFVSQIEHLFGFFLLAICQSINAPPRIGNPSFEILFRMLAHHNNVLSMILRNSEENVLAHEALGPDPFVPDSTEQSAVHEQEKKTPSVGPDDDPEWIKRIWKNLLSVKTKKKE